jgi:hypothetical protein
VGMYSDRQGGSSNAVSSASESAVRVWSITSPCAVPSGAPRHGGQCFDSTYSEQVRATRRARRRSDQGAAPQGHGVVIRELAQRFGAPDRELAIHQCVQPAGLEFAQGFVRVHQRKA